MLAREEGRLPEPRPHLLSTLKEVVGVAVPNMVSYLLTFANEVTNIIMVGRTGSSAELAAVGAGNMMQNCIALSVGIGIASGLDTLISQSHGAEQHELSAYHLQRCRIAVTLQLFWMVPALAFSERLLLLARQPVEVAHYAGQYNRAAVLGLFAMLQFQAAQKFLQHCGKATSVAVINGVTTVLHVGWCALFVLYLRLGNFGTGLANTVTWWSQFLLTTLLLAWVAPSTGVSRQGALWFQRPGLCKLGSYMRVALPSTVQMCSEWWFFEINVLLAGRLGSLAQAAHAASMNFYFICFMIPLGISISTATLVGNALGANKPQKARRLLRTCVSLNVGCWLVIATCTLLFRKYIAAVYTKTADAQKVVQHLLCILAFAGLFDSSQNVMGGALKGMGKQDIGALTNIASFYGIQLPTACVLAFALHMGVSGIWYSFFGTALACSAFLIVFCRLDYKQLARQAAAQAADEAAKSSQLRVTTASSGNRASFRR
eukprot:gnl/TRDRNA2_/TRDRNA2_171755_c0_seq5.p1 gnl/TRDRNA2_/TRDRNA2_171755_c0~~gnl/TRDRNA2_/TRDRNA2_171755_c0_seq5.p1  ORF type:complete len:542 (-),score=67.99 gnl/TRDRNA2_/TRDRNA2_171755_c0_seq5:128-1591(-)